MPAAARQDGDRYSRQGHWHTSQDHSRDANTCKSCLLPPEFVGSKYTGCCKYDCVTLYMVFAPQACSSGPHSMPKARMRSQYCRRPPKPIQNHCCRYESTTTAIKRPCQVLSACTQPLHAATTSVVDHCCNRLTDQLLTVLSQQPLQPHKGPTRLLTCVRWFWMTSLMMP